jgi:hypothetical protein
MSWLGNLISNDDSQVNARYALSVFLTVTGFLAALFMYLAWGLKLLLWPPPAAVPGAPVPLLDIPVNIQAITTMFIVQTIAGAAATLFNRPRPPGEIINQSPPTSPSPPPEAKPPAGPAG